jgi:hypothetical protein
VWGRTDAGRYLQVIFIFPPDDEVALESLTPDDLIDWADGTATVIHVIHARDLEDDERKQYRKRSRKR